MPECISMNGCSRKGGIAGWRGGDGGGKNGPFSGLIDLLPCQPTVASWRETKMLRLYIVSSLNDSLPE